MATITTVTYPLDKESAGASYWKVMHQYAASYPESPKTEDKIQFKIFFKNLLRSFPCESCRQHSKEYILQHPPHTDSRQALFRWMCSFENHVREEQGKEPLQCKLKETEDQCTSCSIDSKDLRSTFKDYKTISIKVFEELCKREKIPMPEIIFAPCPSAPFTSCTHMEKDLLSGKLREHKSKVFLNPAQFSPRTIAHEFLHLAYATKGRDDIAMDEWQIEELAQQLMEKEFPFDKVHPVKDEPLLVMKDTSPYSSTSNIKSTSTKSITVPIPKPKNYLDELNANIDQQFPLFAKYKNMEVQQKIQERQASETGGVLSIFDSIYQPLEEAFGLSARALNEMHTSNILAASATTLMQSNLSPFGSAVASFVTGLSLLGAGVMAKKNLSIGDRRFLSTMGAYFLWNNIGYTNPKVSNDVIIDAKRAGEAAKMMDWTTLQNLIIESPEKKALTTQSQSQAQQQQTVALRRGQRGAGSRSAGGIARSGARPASRPDILRRMQQRAEGLPTAPGTAYRNFPTRNVGRGFGGEFSPNYVGEGGIETTEGEPAIAETLPTTNSIPFWSGGETEEIEEEYSDLV